MKNIMLRIWNIFSIILCVLVILISLIGIAGVWIVEGSTLSALDQTLSFFDKSTQYIRDGVSTVNMGVGNLAESVNEIETAVDRISQNVNDKGLVLTLLPSEKEQELSDTVDSVQEELSAVRDSLIAVQELVQAVNRLPFVNLPSASLASAGKLQTRIDTLTVQVEGLKTGIAEFRSQVSTKISRITDVTANLGSLLSQVQSDLTAVDDELSLYQTKARSLQEVLPTIFILGAIAVTLLFAWIIYSQVLTISRSIQQLRSGSGGDDSLKPEAEIETSPLEKGDSTDSTPTEKAAQSGEEESPAEGPENSIS